MLEEDVGVDTERGDGDGEDVERDRGEANQRDEPVAVECGAEHDPAVDRTAVVESQGLGRGGVATGQLVEGLHESDVRLEGGEEEFEDGGEEDGQPWDGIGDDAGGGEGDNRHSDQAEDHE